MRTWFSASEWPGREVDAALYLCLFTAVGVTEVEDLDLPEMHYWCWANLLGVMFGQWFEGRYTLFFEHDRDAVSFKLTFADALWRDFV